MHIEASFAAGHSNTEDHFQLFLMTQDSSFTNSTLVLLSSRARGRGFLPRLKATPGTRACRA